MIFAFDIAHGGAQMKMYIHMCFMRDIQLWLRFCNFWFVPCIGFGWRLSFSTFIMQTSRMSVIRILWRLQDPSKCLSKNKIAQSIRYVQRSCMYLKRTKWLVCGLIKVLYVKLIILLSGARAFGLIATSVHMLVDFLAFIIAEVVGIRLFHTIDCVKKR